jgi:hypothetical protein
MRTSRWHWALTASLAAAVVYLGLSHLGSPRTQLAGDARMRTVVRPEGPGAGQVAKVDAADAEGAPLRDAMLREALLALSTRQPTPTPDESPLAVARATLDARLTDPATNRGSAAELERAVERLLTPRILGEATAELKCSPRLCRVRLFAEDDARVNQAANTLAENTPKVFAGVVAYPDGVGHKALYLATQASDLNVSPPSVEVAEIAK